MKPLTGGLVGALLMGIAAFGWNARPGSSAEAAMGRGPGQPGRPPPRVGGRAAAGARTVGCAAGVRPRRSPCGANRVSAPCCGRRRAGTASSRPRPAACPTPSSYASSGFVAPGVIDPVAVRPSATWRPSARPPNAWSTVSGRRDVWRRERSWQKRALVIGGSAGAGAGIGALAGGKKGALIGAAIGGGAGTVYEMLHK